MQTPKYIDLFAGCGGLSLGLEQAGWELAFAVEKSPMAAETFVHNIIGGSMPTESLSISEQIESRMVVGPVSDVLSDSEALANFANSTVSLVVGGPPCQGFSLAGTRNPNDKRNKLPDDFVAIVAAAKPTFVVMENVLGMHSKFDQKDELSVYESLAIALAYAGVDRESDPPSYKVQKVLANAAHYGAAQNRPRLLLIACESGFSDREGIEVSDDIWKSSFLDDIHENEVIPHLAPTPTAKKPGTSVRDALQDFLTGKDSDYTAYLKSDVAWNLLPNRPALNHNQRNHGERAKRKFALYQYLSENALPKSLLKDLDDEDRHVLDEQSLFALSYPFTLSDRTVVKSREHLMDLLIEHKTKKHSQRVLDLNSPSPTVVTAADDYIHPTEPRVLTVRELARFQGFPDRFEFRSKETTGGLKRRTEVPQYSQVGNAVSPFLSAAIGKKLLQLLK